MTSTPDALPQPDAIAPADAAAVEGVDALAVAGLAGEIDAAGRTGSWRRTLGRFLVAFAVGAAVAAAIVVVGVYAFESRFQGRILPGVHVGAVDLSDLDRATAAQRLRDAFSGLSSGTIELAGPEGPITISYADAGRAPDIEAMLDDAFATGRPAAPLDRALAEARTVLRGVELSPRVAIDPGVIQARLETMAAGFDRNPISASVVATTDGFEAQASAAGRRVDTSDPATAIVAALSRVDAPGTLTVTLRVMPVEPTVTDAEAAAAATAARAMSTDLVLADGSDSWTIPSAEVRGWVRFVETNDGRYVAAANQPAIRTSLKAIAPKVQRASKSATFLLGKGSVVVGVQPGVDGRSLNLTASVGRIATELARRAAGSVPAVSIAPALTITKPKLATEDAQAVAPLMQQISTWTTWYPISDRNGFGVNIEIPTRAIDGTVVAPGETFDFWKVVGEVSTAAGYRQGGVIINGHTEPQGALAGGICSTSTTIFNAALRAGMLMGARENHYYYIDRYPLGLDATVFISASGATQSMTWTNDTPYPVLVRGSIRHSGGKGYVTFALYSVPTGRTVEIDNPIVKNITPATTVTEQTDTLRLGQRTQVEYPVDGKDVWRTVIVRDSTGRILHETTYYSHYARVDGLIQIGTGGATPSPTPSGGPSPSP